MKMLQERIHSTQCCNSVPVQLSTDMELEGVDVEENKLKAMQEGT
jgi:hypothetical protein